MVNRGEGQLVKDSVRGPLVFEPSPSQELVSSREVCGIPYGEGEGSGVWRAGWVDFCRVLDSILDAGSSSLLDISEVCGSGMVDDEALEAISTLA